MIKYLKQYADKSFEELVNSLIWFDNPLKLKAIFAKLQALISTDTQNALNTKLDKSTTPSSVYATDASGNQEMISRNSFQTALGFTPENLANKENTTLDTSTTKYPTNNLVKTNLDLKQNILVSGTSIKTLEGQSILGSGNIDLNKADVGLSNVDNTSDLNKPISTATQSALNTKLDKVSTVDVEKVYIKNADGSQGVKPISDFNIQNYKTINTNTTLDNTFHGAIVRVKGTINITIPSGLRADFNCIFRTYTGFTATFVAGGGVTINAESNGTILAPRKMCSFFPDATNNYVLSGDLT